MAGRMVVVRTLDIGADKQASYFALPQEEKPGYGDAGHSHLPDQAPGIPTQLRALYGLRSTAIWPKLCSL